MSNKYFPRSISNGKIPFRQIERDEIELLSPRNIAISKEEEVIRLSRETSLSALFTPRWRKRESTDNYRSDEEKLPRKSSNPSRPDNLFSLELEISCDTDVPLPNFPEHVNISNLSPPISEKHLKWLSLSCKGTPPSPRIHHTACVIGDNMFIFGGTDGDSLKNQLFLLDLHTYTWLHPLTTGKKPTHRYGHSCTAVDELLYFFGGKTKTTFLNDFFLLDTKNLKWYKVANKGTVPPAVAYHTAHYYNRKIYIFGGTKIDGSTNDYIYIYDIEKQIWTRNGLKVKGRSMASSMLLSQKHLVMIVGGYRSKNGKFCKSQIKYSLVVDLQTSTVINSSIKTPRLSNHTSFIHEDSLLLFGGRDRELNLSSDLHYFDNNQWRKLDNIHGEQICPTYGQSVVVLQNKILFFGGITTNNVFVKDTYMLQVGAMKNIQSNDIIFELLSQPNADVLHRRSKIKYIENNELTVIERIANGATCIVNLAQWKNKNVVVKQYYNYDREIFLKEIKILCGLRHKNIVKFLGCVMNDEKMCVILKYHHFGDLFNYLKKQITRLEWPLILHMALDVAKGMNYLHQNNILHRDLKSSNLLVASTSYRDKVTIKLMDFGDSKEISHTKEEDACGTARWTAPEVFRKEPYSPKSDVFSFGIILWELVNLRTPYDHLKRDYEVEDYVITGGRPIMHVTPTLCYKQLMEACWDQSPDNRPTFDEIILILEDVCRKLLPVYDNNDLSDRTISDHEDFSDNI